MSFVLGLTGGIATGKSTVSNYFKSLNFPVIDGDVAARKVVEPGTVGLKNIVAHFGETILQADGTLNRKKLGAIVFGDATELAVLNKILSKEIFNWLMTEKAQYEKAGEKLIIMDIPLLYEGHYEKYMDAVMVVYLPEAIQQERLQKRDSLDEKAAQERMKSQMPVIEKKKRADVVIDNQGSIAETQEQVKKWLLDKKFI